MSLHTKIKILQTFDLGGYAFWNSILLKPLKHDLCGNMQVDS